MVTAKATFLFSAVLLSMLFVSCKAPRKPQPLLPSDRTDSIGVPVAETLTEHPFAIERIPTGEYVKLQSAHPARKKKAKVITDSYQIRRMLKGRAAFSDSLETDNLVEIQFDSGNSFKTTDFQDYWLQAYYPSEDILQLEGGHSFEYSVDLKDRMENVGTPQSMFYSPDSLFRLESYFAGQEIDIISVSQRTATGHYRKMADLTELLRYRFKDISIVNVADAFWTDAEHLYIRTRGNDSNGKELTPCFKLTMPATADKDFTFWDGLEEQHAPYRCNINFETIGSRHLLAKRYIDALMLDLHYPACVFYQGIRLQLSPRFLTVLIPIRMGEHELSIHLFHIDNHGRLADEMEVGYDEIAESAFRKYCTFHKDYADITEENDFVEERLNTTLKWKQDGYLIFQSH